MLIHSRINETQQVDTLEQIHRWDTDDGPRGRVKVNVHRDKTYRSQSHSQVRAWTPNGWSIIATGGPDRTHDNDVRDTAAYLLTVARAFLEHPER